MSARRHGHGGAGGRRRSPERHQPAPARLRCTTCVRIAPAKTSTRRAWAAIGRGWFWPRAARRRPGIPSSSRVGRPRHAVPQWATSRARPAMPFTSSSHAPCCDSVCGTSYYQERAGWGAKWDALAAAPPRDQDQGLQLGRWPQHRRPGLSAHHSSILRLLACWTAKQYEQALYRARAAAYQLVSSPAVPVWP